MSKLGIQCVMYAKRDRNGMYTGAKDISTLVQFNGAPNNITAEDYGDNRAVISHRSTNKINLSMELNDMAGKEYADICGHEYDAELKKVTVKSTDRSPYIGIGAIGNSEKEDGSEVFIMKMYRKAQFSEPNDDNSTETDTKEYKHVSLEGTCYPDEKAEREMKVEQEFETLEEAKAELARILGGKKGADSMEIPKQDQSLGEANGNVQVSELIGEDVSVKWDGMKGAATGTVKKDPASVKSLYGNGEKTGHFFPIQFDETYFGKEVDIIGSTKGHKTVKRTAEDQYLIVRLENLGEDSKLTARVKDTQEEIFELDFTGVTKQGDV